MRFEFVDGAIPIENEALTYNSTLTQESGEGEGEGDDTEDERRHTPMVASPSTLTLSYDWDELNVYDKMMAVICICHVPTVKSSPSTDLNTIHQQFQDVRAQLHHPGGPFIYKCYAFDSDQASIEQMQPSPAPSPSPSTTREYWSMIPSPAPAASTTPVSSAFSTRHSDDRAHIDFYLQTCLYDLAAGLIDNYEASIKKLPPTHDLKSPLEAASYTLPSSSPNTSASVASSSSPTVISPSEQQARAKKVRPGRHKKYVADYCLLAGDCLYASKQYRLAADACRSASDHVWHASCLSGLASSLVALDDEKDADQRTFQETVVELYEESLAILARVSYASILSISISFILARYYQQWSRPLESSHTIMRMYEWKMDCSAHDQIALAIEAAILCHQLGFYRKFGFFLVQAAGLYRELHQSASCHALLRMASVTFGIPDLNRNVLDMNEVEDHDQLYLWSRTFASTSVRDPHAWYAKQSSLSLAQRSERGIRPGGGLRWAELQRTILEHLIYSTKQMQAQEMAAELTAYLLRTLHPWLDAAYQATLVSDLWSATKEFALNHNKIEMSGLPVIHSVRPLEYEPTKRPWYDPTPPTDDDGDASTDTKVYESDEDELPRMKRVREAEHGDVFLMRPDEDHAIHIGKKTRVAPTKLSLACHEPFEFEVILSNPLKVPLLIQHMSPACTNPRSSSSSSSVETFVISFTLPPETYAYKVLLTCRPERVGSIAIDGIYIRMFNLLWKHSIDPIGDGIRPSYDDVTSSPYCPEPSSKSASLLAPVLLREIEVLPPIPELELRMDCEHEGGNVGGMGMGLGLGSVLHIGSTPSVSSAPTSSPTPGSSSGSTFTDTTRFLYGEMRESYILLHNIGRLPIADLALRIRPIVKVMTKRSQAKYYQNKAEQEEMEHNLRLKATETGEHPPDGSTLVSDSVLPSSSASHDVSDFIRFDHASLRSQLPLEPGRIMRLKVDLESHEECDGAHVTIEYAAERRSNLFRSIERRVRWIIEGGVKLKHINLCHFGRSTTTPTIMPTPATSNMNHPYPSYPFHHSATSPAPFPTSSPSPPVPGYHRSPHTSANINSNSNATAASSSDCIMILEVSNTASSSFHILATIDGHPSPQLVPSHSATLDKYCEQRLLFPLPRLTLGTLEEERHLRRLAARSVNDRRYQNDAIYQRLLQRFYGRIKVTWRSSDEAYGRLDGFEYDPYEDGPSPLTPQQLAMILPDVMDFSYDVTCIEPNAQMASTSSATPSSLTSATTNDPFIGSPIFRSPTPQLIDFYATPAQEATATSTLIGNTPSNVTPSPPVSFPSPHSTHMPRLMSPPLPPRVSLPPSVRIGSFHRLSIQVRPGPVPSQFLLRDRALELVVLPFQESVNGNVDTSLKGKLLIVGSLTKTFEKGYLKEIHANQENNATSPYTGSSSSVTLVHQLLLCFTSVGRFQFQFIVREKDECENVPAASAGSDTISVTAESSTDQDPFALLESIADTLTGTVSASSASVLPHSHPPPPPLSSTSHSHTIRRRSIAPSEIEDDTSIGLSTLAVDRSRASSIGSYQLDVDSESESEDGPSLSSSPRATSIEANSSRDESSALVYKCPTVLVIQAGLQ